jgi:DNA replication and repair protein RecF
LLYLAWRLWTAPVEAAEIGAQVWMTGADPAAFADVAGQAQVLEVTPGRIAPRA